MRTAVLFGERPVTVADEQGRADPMSGGNGVDIAAVYQLLTEVARTVAGHDRKLDDIAGR